MPSISNVQSDYVRILYDVLNLTYERLDFPVLLTNMPFPSFLFELDGGTTPVGYLEG